MPYLVLTAAILVVFAVILHLMGRVGWYKDGFGLWTSSAQGPRTSQDFLDPYSFTHVLHGIIFYGLLYPLRNKLSIQHRFLAALLVEVAWELFENSPPVIDRFRAATASLDYYGDTILNSIGDVLTCQLGFWLAMRLPVKLTIALSVIEELALLILVRDNLTLNILMLIHPIQAIKDWQMGG